MPDMQGRPFGDWRDDKDVLEAENEKYSNNVWHFTQLASGNYAVYNHARQLVACVPFTVMEELYATRIPPVTAERRSYQRPARAARITDTLTIDDLDL